MFREGRMKMILPEKMNREINEIHKKLDSQAELFFKS